MNTQSIKNHLQASEIIEVREWAQVLWVKAVVTGRVVCRFVSKKFGEAKMKMNDVAADFAVTLASAAPGTIYLNRSLFFVLGYENRGLNREIGATFNYTFKCWELKVTSANLKDSMKKIAQVMSKNGISPVFFGTKKA